jgi:hypothetical protein
MQLHRPEQLVHLRRVVLPYSGSSAPDPGGTPIDLLPSAAPAHKLRVALLDVRAVLQHRQSHRSMVAGVV